MLLVVFGAGASYDSCSTFLPEKTGIEHMRPPLARDLFRNKGSFRELMRKFPKCFDVLPRLEAPPAGSTVERELERLLRLAAEDDERPRQLMSIRFYLRNMIWQCVDEWRAETKGASNYKALLDSVRSAKYQFKTCIVTFNYDLMLEDALQSHGVPIHKVEDYVATTAPYKAIKLHGSVNWAHVAYVRPENVVDKMTNVEVEAEIIEKANNLVTDSDYFAIIPSPTSKIGDRTFSPALAIPIETKNFECPKEHIDFLTAHLPEVTKILIVGWAGNDQAFLQLLKERLNGAPRIAIVAGTAQGGKDIRERLTLAGIQGYGSDFDNITVSSGGFSEFVRGEADRFLES